MGKMGRPKTTTQRKESKKAMQKSDTTSKTDRTVLTILPREIRDMIYGLVLGEHTIHIKSDMLPQKSDSEDDKHGDGGYDSDDEEEDEEEVEPPAELLEILSDDRGPLYHTICNKELLHPKDAQLYRIRSLEANGSRNTREQLEIAIKDFKHVKCPKPSDLTLECETIGTLEEEEGDKPPVQVELAFLRANKQLYEEASTLLYSTRTFAFDDAATFAQFFSIEYSYIAEPPTSTNGTNIPAMMRNTIRSVHIRAKTALCLQQKVQWMAALDAAAFVLPRLETIRVLFDLCHEGNERHVDGTLWQYWRHRNGFPLLKTAEVCVATHLSPVLVGNDREGECSYELRDVRWRVQLLEAIVGHHMDVLFGVSLLDPVSVAERDDIFDQE